MTDVPEIHARPKIVGARVKRTEDPRLLTGLGSYTDDRQVARVLHVAFRRSDQSHARILGIGCEAARAAPGVIAVLTAEDLADGVKPLVATSRMPNYYATPIFPLARGKVRYVGEPVVGVIAESRYQAEDALELIAVDYEPLPVVIDPETAVGDGAPLLHEEARTNVLVSREFKRGDVDAAMDAAPVRVKGRFRMHRKTPVAMEPRACLAEYDAGRDALTLHSATQVPGIVRDALVRRTRHARPPDPCGGARCRRRLRRQGLALSRGDFRLCRRASARAPGQVDQRPHGGFDLPTARASMRSSMPSSVSTATAMPWRCART